MERRGAQSVPSTHNGAVFYASTDNSSGFCKSIKRAALFLAILVTLFALMVWDLRKAQMLSAVIHDDHGNHWESMNVSSLRAWYGAIDLCKLRVPYKEHMPTLPKNHNCSVLSGTRGSTELHLSCNVGASIGESVCDPPYSQRTYYKSKLRDPVLGDPENMLLVSALKRFSTLRKPIVYVGDGISKQNLEAMFCEMLRTDRVKITGASGAIDGNYSIIWRSTLHQIDVYYMKLTNMYNNGQDYDPTTDMYVKESKDHTDNNQAAKRFLRNQKNSVGPVPPHKRRQPRRTKYQNQTNWRVLDRPVNNSESMERDLLMSSIPNDVVSNVTVNIPLSLTLEDIKSRVNSILAGHLGVVLIVNVGVWYNSREKFRKELPDLLSWMNELNKERNSTVLFRETAAQHWNHTSFGYYDQNYAAENSGTCVPVADATPEFDWRNTDVYHMIENSGYNIGVIPFRDITLPLYNMHPSSAGNGTGSSGEDCTHYCYFPQMWQPVWQQLKLAADLDSKLDTAVDS